MLKGKLVLQKNPKFLSLGGSQTPMSLAAGGFASRPPTASDGQWPQAARDADPSSKDVRIGTSAK